jgi:hypothetical protein
MTFMVLEEAVLADLAIEMVEAADMITIIGTSMQGHQLQVSFNMPNCDTLSTL